MVEGIAELVVLSLRVSSGKIGGEEIDLVIRFFKKHGFTAEFCENGEILFRKEQSILKGVVEDGE